MWTYTRKTGIQPIKIMDLSEKIGMQPSKMWGLQNPRKIASTKHNRKKEKGRRNRSKQGNCLSDPWTRYTPHRRPWRFGHFLQLALTFVHQHFLQGTSAYLRFVPFFLNVSGDVAVQWRTELVTWVLGAVAKTIETRVPKLLEKDSVTVLLLCGIDMSREPHPTPAPAPHPGTCGTSTTCAAYKER